jgi:hypothetical protein
MRPVNAARDVSRPGVNFTPSMISRSAPATLDAGTDVLPFCSWTAPCGPGWVTTAVCADVAEPGPSGFVAVTVTRSVLPTSADCTLYVCAVAPAIGAHALPLESQRCHWYV